jgi:hypothetical protein
MVEADMEIFEDGDVVPLVVDSREMPLERPPTAGILVKYDRPYAISPDRKALVEELAQIAGARANQEFKKSVDPVSALTIVASFAVGAIASGFLKKIGEDGYELFKAKLKQLFSSKPPGPGKDQLLIFLYAVDVDSVPVNVEVILTNPTPDEIAAYFSSGAAELQGLIKDHVQPSLGIRQVTYSFRDGKLHLEYAVRKDAVPLLPARRSG